MENLIRWYKFSFAVFHKRDSLNPSIVFKFVPFCRYLSFRSQNCWSISQITENTVLFSSHSVCSNLWSKNVSLTSFLPEVAKIEIWKFCNIVSFSEFQILSFYILWRKPCHCWYARRFFACLCHCHCFNPFASLVFSCVLKLLLEFYSWAFIMYVIQWLCVYCGWQEEPAILIPRLLLSMPLIYVASSRLDFH